MKNAALKLASGFALLAAPSLQAHPHEGTPAAQTEAVSTEALEAAVANEDRPEASKALDQNRKPAEILAFFGLKTSDDAADLVAGGGYWAEILAKAVGEDGSVTAVEPVQFFNQARWDALKERSPSIALETYRFEALEAGTSRFDFAILNLNYHDAYWESEQFDVPRSDPEDFLAAVFRAMKPGGVVGVIDHTGPAGDTRAIVEDLHRIDPDIVRADFRRAGFILEAESDMLANPEDPIDISAFDPSIRGKTDRFVFRFRKPAN